MRGYIISTVALACVSTVNGNIFKDLQRKLEARSNALDDAAGIEKRLIPNTNMYYYKLVPRRSTSSTPSSVSIVPTVVDTPPPPPTVIVENVPVFEHPVVVQDTPKYDPVISKNKKSEEVGEVVEDVEKDHVYGKDSPLRDDAVANAWAKADEAQRRLENHREYMEQLRRLRLEKAAAKDIDGAKSNN